MDSGELLRLDYDQTNELIRTLLDVRFKLRAFVMTAWQSWLLRAPLA